MEPMEPAALADRHPLAANVERASHRPAELDCYLDPCATLLYKNILNLEFVPIIPLAFGRLEGYDPLLQAGAPTKRTSHGRAATNRSLGRYCSRQLHQTLIFRHGIASR